MPPSSSRLKSAVSHHIEVVDPLTPTTSSTCVWQRISFGSPRDTRKPTATTVAVPDTNSVRLGRVRLSGGAVGTVSEVHLKLRAVHLSQSPTSSRALLVRVPRAVIRSLIALDETALAAITANAERWFDDFELDYLEQYYRESTKQSDAGGTVVPLARFALLPAEKSKKGAGAAEKVPLPVGQCVDIVLQLCGLNFQRRQVALAWKVVSVTAAVDVASKFAFVDDDSSATQDGDDVMIPEADAILQQDDPDAWYDDAGPGAEARDEMLADLRSRINAERDKLERRMRDIDDVTAMTDDPTDHMRAMHAATALTERLGF